MSLPTITATGRLTADPDLRRTDAGTAVCRVRLACTERRHHQGGWVDGATTFLDADVLGRSAKDVAATFRAGDLVVVTGALLQRERRDGGHAYVLRADALGRVEVPVRAA